MKRLRHIVQYTVLFAILISYLAISVLSAAERTWDGASGADGNWQNSDNWNTVPVADDSLTFGDGSPSGWKTTNNNNFAADTNFGLIKFIETGFTLAGSSVTLASGGGIENTTGTNIVNLNLKLGDSLSFTNSGTSLTVGGTVDNDGNTLTVTGTGNTTISKVISGSGGLTKDGNGTLTLSAQNTYTGATTISAGSLKYTTNDNILSDSTAVTVASGATLDTQGKSDTIGSLAGAGNVILYSGTLTAGGNDTSTAFSGVISGSGGNFTKAGSGTLTLSGTNTYTGTTTVSTGTITLGAGTVLADTSDLTVSSGAVFNLAGNSETVDTLSGAGNVTLGAGTLSADGNNTTYSGVMSGAGGFTKSGSGKLTFSGTNTYTGNTTVTGNTLALGANDTIHNSSSVVVNGGTLDVSTFTDTVAGVQLTNFGKIIGSGGTLSSTSDFDVQNGEVTAKLGGSVGLTKTTTSTVTLSGANSYTGTTTVTAGTLTYAEDNVTSDSSDVNVNGGTLNIVSYNDSVGAVTLTSGIITGTTGVLTGSSYTVKSGSAYAILGGSGINLLKDTAGTVTMNKSNTYTGTTTISAGSLKYSTIDNILSDSTAVTVASGATLDIQSKSDTIGSLAGAGDVVLYSGTLTAGGDNSSTAFSGVASGSSGNITKAGSGTLTLSGTNTYTGTTTVSAGTISLGADNVLADASDLTVSSGAVFNMAGNSDTVDTLSGAGNITLGAGTLTADGNNTTYSGVMSGSGGFTKSGAGKLTFTGTNTYTGNTTVTGNTLALGANNTISNSSSVLVDNATLDISTFSDTVAGVQLTTAGVINGSGGTLASTTDFDVRWGTVSAKLGGSAGLTKTTGSTVTLTGANSYTDTTTVTAGTLTYGADNVTSDSSDINVNGGTLNIVSYNDTVDAVTLTSGIITGTTGVLTGSSYTVKAGTVSAILGGSGVNLLKDTAGTVTMSKSNTYTGTTTISAGSLKYSAANVLSDSTAVTVDSGAAYDIQAHSDTIGSLAGAGNVILFSGSLTAGGDNSTTVFSGVLSGPGGGNLTKAGSGTFTLSGTNTHSGATTVNAGTLSVTGSISSSATTINSGGTLGGTGTTGSVTVANGGIIAPGTSIGILNTGGQVWSPGGNYYLEVSGTSSDLLNMSGDLDISGLSSGGDEFIIQISGSPAVTLWTIAQFNNDITADFAANKFTIDDQTGYGADSYTLQLGLGGTSLQMNSSVPEPSTYAFFAIGLIGLIGTAIRKRRKT